MDVPGVQTVVLFSSKTNHQINVTSADFEKPEQLIAAAADQSTMIHHHDIRLQCPVQTRGLMRRSPDYFHIT